MTLTSTFLHYTKLYLLYTNIYPETLTRSGDTNSNPKLTTRYIKEQKDWKLTEYQNLHYYLNLEGF